MEIKELGIRVGYDNAKEWMPHLYDISTPSMRVVGCMYRDSPNWLYGVVQHLIEVRCELRQGPQPQVQIAAIPNDLAPVDLLSVVPKMYVTSASIVIHVADLNPMAQEWYRTRYLNVVVGAPKITVPEPQPSSPIKLA